MPRVRPPFPFLKWAGGKRKLAARIGECMPEHFDVYAEPFLGGGAVFMALVRTRRFDRAILCDRNPELINLWIQVRDNVAPLIEAAGQWVYGEEEFYEVRALSPTDPIQIAARTLWLNRTCYNGLYRKNSKGTFNVPFGRYSKPPIINIENLNECSRVLQDVELRVSDFEPLLAEAQAGWVVYCDPPYWPLSETSKFTNYDGHNFTADDQSRLADAFAALPRQGAHGVLSNSSTPETRRLYSGLQVDTVLARRNINRNANGRGPVEELLVTARSQPATT